MQVFCTAGMVRRPIRRRLRTISCSLVFKMQISKTWHSRGIVLTVCIRLRSQWPSIRQQITCASRFTDLVLDTLKISDSRVGSIPHQYHRYSEMVGSNMRMSSIFSKRLRLCCVNKTFKELSRFTNSSNSASVRLSRPLSSLFVYVSTDSSYVRLHSTTSLACCRVL